mmetsp:Transcript_66074/g.123246  ORF Transcript_66074/g.123246 Transcript_66074/m.123246 type:complete len:271 (+) Transcript_66074:43-855(+)
MAKAAVASVSISRAAAEALKMVGGRSVPAHMTFHDWLQRRLHTRGLEQAKFEAGYFETDFLEGSKQVLMATSSAVSSQLHGEQDTTETDFMQSRLVDYFSEHREKLAKDNLSMAWDIKNVSDVRLGSFSIALGLRRRHLVSNPNVERMFHFGAAGVSVVYQEDKPRRVTFEDVVESFGLGGTLAVEAVITCTQETCLYRAGCEEPEVRKLEENVTHLLTLEADLHGSDGDSQWPYFNTSRGWILSDFNRMLEGNSVLAQVKSADTQQTGL